MRALNKKNYITKTHYAGMQPSGSTATIRHRNSNDEDDDFEDEQPLLEPFTQLSLDKPSTSKHPFMIFHEMKVSNL